MIALDKREQTRLHQMARHLAFTTGMHECPEELTRDLEQAAYLKLMLLKKRDYLWKDLQYAMLEELSRWKYACKRGREKSRVLRYKHGLGDVFIIFGKPKPLEEVLT